MFFGMKKYHAQLSDKWQELKVIILYSYIFITTSYVNRNIFIRGKLSKCSDKVNVDRQLG